MNPAIRKVACLLTGQQAAFARALPQENTSAKLLLGSTLVLAALAAPVAGLAQDSYPSKPIRIVVAWSADGGHDVMAPLLGQELGTILSTPVVVDNVTGAGGTTGMRQFEGARRTAKPSVL